MPSNAACDGAVASACKEIALCFVRLSGSPLRLGPQKRQHMITASRPLHTGRLVLTPLDPAAEVAEAALADCLQSVGLIGEPLPGPGAAFETGERFLQLIAFTGCAVHLDTAARAAGNPFAQVALRGPYPVPRLLFGRNSRPPRCRHCGKPLADWRSQVERWRGEEAREMACPYCGAATVPGDWDWRQHAGVGRSFVFIEEVFPGEGSPLPPLFAALERLGVGSWRHFYIQSEGKGDG
jgi:DNA-directed RNA polymerase subunit RPC12/RpoP